MAVTPTIEKVRIHYELAASGPYMQRTVNALRAVDMALDVIEEQDARIRKLERALTYQTIPD